MSQPFKLTLPEPCSQPWESLKPQSDGRFCDAWQKTVVDFSLMTDQELVAYFQSHSGRVCGRLAPWQTDRIITPAPNANRPFSLPGIAVALMGLLLSFSGRAQFTHPVKQEPLSTLAPLPPKPIPNKPIPTPSLVPPAYVSLVLQGRMGGVSIQPVEVNPGRTGSGRRSAQVFLNTL